VLLLLVGRKAVFVVYCTLSNRRLGKKVLSKEEFLEQMATLTTEQKVLRANTRSALESARHLLHTLDIVKAENGAVTREEVSNARSRLACLMNKFENNPRLYDLPTSQFFVQKEITPPLAQVLMDERIHMLSGLAKRPLEEAKTLIESSGHKFPIALEWTHAALNRTRQVPMQNSWLGSLTGFPANVPASA
jgi:hypothetical protein